jgi:hypothetical protein
MHNLKTVSMLTLHANSEYIKIDVENMLSTTKISGGEFKSPRMLSNI